jgi:hypothetical protein
MTLFIVFLPVFFLGILFFVLVVIASVWEKSDERNS